MKKSPKFKFKILPEDTLALKFCFDNQSKWPIGTIVILWSFDEYWLDRIEHK